MAPAVISGPALFSALRNIWNGSSARGEKQSCARSASHGPDFGNHGWPAELRTLVDPLVVIRRRILTNAFLGGWMKVWTWILTGLIVAAAFSPKLAWAWVSAAALIAIGAVAPNGMILRQRQDAVMRLVQVNPHALFPLRLPAAARRTFVLTVAAAGLFVYRIYYKPPIVALLQATARSQLVQSILSPIAHAMEKDLQRTMALINSKPDSPADEVRSTASAAPDDLWKSSDERGAKLGEGQQDSLEANAGDQMQDQPSSSMQGDQGEAQQADSQQQEDGERQSQQANNGSERMGGDAQQQPESQNSENNRQSLSQSLMQALKNMLSNSQNQQANNQANQKQPNSQGMPQSGNSRQPGSGEADKKGDSRGTSDAQQKASQNSSSGAGSQQGSKELRRGQASRPVNAVPDRVALESNGFKEKTRMHIDNGTGTARLLLRDLSPQAVAVTNGAEQENIPARYRLYVQHYFEHAENGQK